MRIPACANDHCTSPEQSKAAGPDAPQTYGSPCRPRAAFSIVTIRAWPAEAPLPARPDTPAAVASVLVTPALTCVMSGSVAAPCGMTRFTAVARDARLACGALITMALEAGM